MTDSDVDVTIIVGLHHVRLPVSDVMRSRDCYLEVFGFEPRLTFEEETRVVGVVVALRNGLTLGLHDAPRLAASCGDGVLASTRRDYLTPL